MKLSRGAFYGRFADLADRSGLIARALPLTACLILSACIASCGTRERGISPAITPGSAGGAALGSSAASLQRALGKTTNQVILLAVMHEGMAETSGVMKEIKNFREDPKYSAVTEILMIDPRRESEKEFLTQFQISVPIEKPVTVVLAAGPWQILSAIKGPLTKSWIANLVEAHRPRAPGGSGDSSCPT